MDELRFCKMDNGKRLLSFAGVLGDASVIEEWELVTNYDDMLDVLWDIRHTDLDNIASIFTKQSDAKELEVLENWRQNGITVESTTGTSLTIVDENGKPIELTAVESPERKKELFGGGFKCYIEPKTKTMRAYVCWARVNNVNEYNQAMQQLRRIRERLNSGW